MDSPARMALRSLLAENGVMEAARILLGECNLSPADVASVVHMAGEILQPILADHHAEVQDLLSSTPLWLPFKRVLHRINTSVQLLQVGDDPGLVQYSFSTKCSFPWTLATGVPWDLTDLDLHGLIRDAHHYLDYPDSDQEAMDYCVGCVPVLGE